MLLAILVVNIFTLLFVIGGIRTVNEELGSVCSAVDTMESEWKKFNERFTSPPEL